MASHDNDQVQTNHEPLLFEQIEDLRVSVYNITSRSFILEMPHNDTTYRGILCAPDNIFYYRGFLAPEEEFTFVESQDQISVGVVSRDMLDPSNHWNILACQLDGQRILLSFLDGKLQKAVCYASPSSTQNHRETSCLRNDDNDLLFVIGAHISKDNIDSRFHSFMHSIGEIDSGHE